MMEKLLTAILAALLFVSCAGNSERRFQNFTATPELTGTSGSFIITNYKNKDAGEKIPEWADLWINFGVHEVEAHSAYQDRYVFISRNEGNNLNALTQWARGFSPELDFPRLVAVRIEARLSASVTFPDDEYGAFYETLIRTAADTTWTGIVREDDFWIHREFTAGSEEYERPAWADNIETDGRSSAPVKETLEYFILVTINKSHFASQLDDIFRKVNPKPQPSRNQLNAVNKVKERFFDGF